MEHLVAKCPACDRPIWAKTLGKLLGFTVGKRDRTPMGFIAAPRGGGKRGGKAVRGMSTLADVAREGGEEAVEQLRRLARRTFARLWAYGLLTKDDVAEVMSVKRAEGDVSSAPAPARALSFLNDYRPGSQVTTRVAPTLPKVNPNPAPARALKWPT